MTAPSLKQQTFRALAWSFFDRMGQQVLLFAVGIVVANILPPQAFGLVGMLAIFSAVGTILLDSGFSAAIIQRKTTSDAELSSVFWFNVAVSTAVYVVLVLCSPLIASFFEQPMLVQLAPVVFATLPAYSLGIIQSTMLSKNLRFKQLARINLLAMVISACASLAMAFTGCEVWTLAWQPVILAGSRTILLWCQGDWRPRGGFRFAAIRELLPFASGLLFASLLNTLFLNVYGFVIGKIYPILQMSYYTQGSRTADMGVTTLYGTIQSATYPIFSSIQDDRARLIRSYRKTMRVTAFATFPVMAALVVSAPALFDLLLKDEWLPAVPFFRWLCVGGCFTILCAINNNFIKVSGRSDAILKLEYCIIALTAVAVIATIRHDVLTMVTGLVAVRIAVYLINIWFTARHTGYTMLAQLRDIAPYLLLAAVSAAVAMFVGKLFTGCILTLAAQFLSLAAVYLLLALLLGSKVVKESFQILFSRRRDG